MMSVLMLVEGNMAQPSMTGYDCGTPVQTIITRKDWQCTMYRDKPKVTKSILIQKEIELTLQGFKCAVVHTRRVHYCGIWSYTQSIPVGYKALPKRVSVAECQAMVRQQYYTEGGDKKYPLSVPGLTNLNLQRAGSERISDGQLRCDGADIQESEVFLKSVVVEEQLSVEITKEEYHAVDNTVEAIFSRTIVLCAVDAKGCAGPKETFIWNKPRHDCTY